MAGNDVLIFTCIDINEGLQGLKGGGGGSRTAMDRVSDHSAMDREHWMVVCHPVTLSVANSILYSLHSFLVGWSVVYTISRPLVPNNVKVIMNKYFYCIKAQT